MDTTEINEVLLEAGITSDSERKTFLEMHDTVFNASFSIMPLLTPTNSDIAPTPTSPEADSVISSFRAVYKLFIRRTQGVYLSSQDLTTASCKAASDFTKALRETMDRLQENLDPAILTKMAEDLTNQMGTEVKWIKIVNGWIRNKFVKTCMDNAMSHYNRQVWLHYPFENTKFYASAEIRKFSDELMDQSMKRFVEEMPSFESQSQVEQWREELRLRLSTPAQEFAQRNTTNRDTCFRIQVDLTISGYKELMDKFLDSNPFVEEAKLDKYHHQMKAKCETEEALSSFFVDAEMKENWDKRIGLEYLDINVQWKLDRDYKLEEVRKALQIENQRIFQEKFNLGLDKDNLESFLLGQYTADKVARIVEKTVDESDSDSSDEEIGSNGNCSDSDDTTILVRRREPKQPDGAPFVKLEASWSGSPGGGVESSQPGCSTWNKRPGTGNLDATSTSKKSKS